MALPPHFTTLNLSGQFVLNDTLSDHDSTAQQGIDVGLLEDPKLLSFNHYTDDDGTERIWVQKEADSDSDSDSDSQPSSRSRSRSKPRTKVVDTENRILDWRERPRHDPLLGPVVGRTRRISTHTLAPPFLRSGWTPDTLKYGVLQYHVYSDTTRSGRTWCLTETWGIELIAGHRHFARHVRFTPTGGVDVERHLVYDYVGEV
ncbi:hypothetical protein B0H19DRAFT_1089134 [Mycena capillaripes]|nr:hypothetical protein B0H19DRAFT_1089134 [Mycena capillaripes]